MASTNNCRQQIQVMPAAKRASTSVQELAHEQWDLTILLQDYLLKSLPELIPNSTRLKSSAVHVPNLIAFDAGNPDQLKVEMPLNGSPPSRSAVKHV